MTIDVIRAQLINLRLPRAAESLDLVLQTRKSKTDIVWLSELLERELDQRKDNAVERRIKQAGFPERRTFEQFDWDFNKKIPRDKIEELQSLEFIKNNEIGLFLGATGTGKTHCAISIGMLAARAGYSVYCTSVKRLGTKIRLAEKEGKLDRLFKQILTSKLWILDDWGVVSMPRDVSEEIFDLFDRRKNNSAMLLTSNRDVTEWPQVFSDPILASAAIDRMFDRANVCVFEGPSHRLKGRIICKDIEAH